MKPRISHWMGLVLLAILVVPRLACAAPGLSKDERQAFAQHMFAQHPQYFPNEHRADILAGVVALGMTPYEAKLAGGAFAFKVTPDPSKWSANSDPYDVMWAQSASPDNSKIWMIFNNFTQSKTGSAMNFRVAFEQGVAVRIERLDQ